MNMRANQTFTGKAWDWGKPSTGQTGEQHPFRRRTAQGVRQADRRREAKERLTVDLLEAFGVPVGSNEGDLEGPLQELDRFVEQQRLDYAGVDRVLERFSRARYQYEEESETEQW